METVKIGYESPETKALVLKSRRVLCQSGSMQDYNANTWEGKFDDAD